MFAGSLAQFGGRGAGLVLGGVLFAAGVKKSVRPGPTLTSLEELFSPSGGLITLLLLVAAEVCLGCLLVFGVRSRALTACTGILIATFAAWVSFLWATNSQASCGCGVHWLRVFPQATDRANDAVRVLFIIALFGLSELGRMFRPASAP